MHYILQRLGITPDELMQKPRLIRMFIMESMKVQIETEANEMAALRQRQRDAAASRGRRR